MIHTNKLYAYNGVLVGNTDRVLGYPDTLYDVTVISSGHGTATANPVRGRTGTTITLTDYPDTGYELANYSVTGATLKNANQFDIADSDVYVNCIFKEDTNPLHLPAHTIRVKFAPGYPLSDAGDSRTLVDAEQNIWDIYKANTGSPYDYSWNAWDLFGGHGSFDGPFSVLEVLGANTTGISCFTGMFSYCGNMTKVALFDTSNAVYTQSMFSECSALTEIPKYDLSNVVHCGEMFNRTRISVFPELDLSNVDDASYMFFKCTGIVEPPILRTSNKLANIRGMFDMCYSLKRMPNICTDSITSCSRAFCDCYSVESGILDMYNRLSANGIAANNHVETFLDCGRDSITGSAELAQIPEDWKA